MRVLIIGGTAFMGPHVVRGLLQSGHDVTIFHRGTTGTCDDGATHIHGDRLELPNYRTAFERAAPNVVIHMIAMNQTDADLTIEAIRGIAQRVVVISSMDVYRAYGRFVGKDEGDIDNTPLTEDAPLRQNRYPYRIENMSTDSVFFSYDKIIVEDAFLGSADFRTTVLRLPAVYGPNDRQHRTFDYVKRMVDGRRAILLDNQMADWRWSRGYVDDVASGICLAAEADAAGRIYNIAEPNAQTEHEWLKAIALAMRWTGEIVLRPSKDTDHRWAQHIASDSSRIRSELGYRERISAEQAIRRTVEWEASQISAGAFDRPVDYTEEDKILNS